MGMISAVFHYLGKQFCSVMLLKILIRSSPLAFLEFMCFISVAISLARITTSDLSLLPIGVFASSSRNVLICSVT